MSRPIVIFMINVIKNIKKVGCIVIWLSCLVRAENSNEITLSIDFSVYSGQGSILLHWSIPSSIKVKNIIIYSQQFGDKEFKEIAPVLILREQLLLIKNK